MHSVSGKSSICHDYGSKQLVSASPSTCLLAYDNLQECCCNLKYQTAKKALAICDATQLDHCIARSRALYSKGRTVIQEPVNTPAAHTMDITWCEVTARLSHWVTEREEVVASISVGYGHSLLAQISFNWFVILSIVPNKTVAITKEEGLRKNKQDDKDSSYSLKISSYYE
ncbi:hypothetical protein J6590_098104 [Homalodisca vitripennis]|nr:hypothetical protein J6590_098104 [Homalodisca vitripennis]